MFAILPEELKDYYKMDEATVKSILSRANIAYKSGHVKNNSANYIGMQCPFCNDKSTHGGVKKSTGSFHCHKCSESKSLFDFIESQTDRRTAIDIFVDAGIFETRKVDPDTLNKLVAVKKDDRVELSEYEQKILDMFQNPENYLSNLTLDNGSATISEVNADVTLIPKGVNILKSKKAIDYLKNGRDVVIPMSAIIKIANTLKPIYVDKVDDPSFGKTEYSRKWLEKRIYFPIYVDGVLMSWNAKDISNNDSAIRYATPRLVDCREVTQNLIWPFDLLNSVKGDLLLIEEGLFDSLPFLAYGKSTSVYSCCIFTNNITKNQLELIQRIAPNFKGVVLMLDRGEEVKSFKLSAMLSEKLENFKGFHRITKVKDTGEIPYEKIPGICTKLKRMYLDEN